MKFAEVHLGARIQPGFLPGWIYCLFLEQPSLTLCVKCLTAVHF